VEVRNRWIGVAVAFTGVGVCVTALVGFLLAIVKNNLPWDPGNSIREFYQLVGESYAQGFTVGFFLCFFLTLVVVAAWPTERRGSMTDCTAVPARQSAERRLRAG